MIAALSSSSLARKRVDMPTPKSNPSKKRKIANRSPITMNQSVLSVIFQRPPLQMDRRFAWSQPLHNKVRDEEFVCCTKP